MKKLFENWKQYLHEIGDASQEPYSFKVSEEGPDSKHYTFETEGAYKYEVGFYDNAGIFAGDNPSVHIDFHTKQTMYSLTNEAQPLKIMSTVVHIIKDYLRGRSEYPITFEFDGALKRGEDAGVEGTRTRLYKRYIKGILGKDVKMSVDEEDPNIIKFVVEEKP